MSLIRRLTPALAAVGTLLLAFPSVVLGHQITERYQAPLPLVIYIGGAVLAVGMSFAFVILRNPPPPSDREDGPVRTVPAWLRGVLGVVGLIGWLWIVAQTLFGGNGAGDVASLFLWVYGWVGLALVSAFIGPVWSWLDPFSTIHRLLTWFADRLGMTGAEPPEYPARLGRWPAAIGFIAIVWIELVARVDGGHTLGLLLIAYTLVTLAGMAYYGRETWRSNGEIFSVWFRLLGRLAPYAPVGEPEDGQVRRRSFGSGLLSGGWSTDQLVIVAMATGAIILDGLSQTELYYDLFSGINILGLPILRDTLVGALFLGGLVAIVLFIARRLGVAALGAGLLPVAVGYLIAHYLTYLLIDGQRIIAAINDPLLRGDNLLPFDLGFYEPQPFLPAAIVWSIQLAAVVGGHVVGAWAGHAALVEEGLRVEPRRQLPLAALMVALTSLTLWSLGQAVLSPTVQPQPTATASVTALDRY
jgi:hypothetical protein